MAAGKVKIKNRLFQVIQIILVDVNGHEYGRQLAPKELTEEIDEKLIAQQTKSLCARGHIKYIREK